MPVISVTLPSDGTSANVADYNDPINQILALLNGQLDSDNIASLSGVDLSPGTVPQTAFDATAKLGWFTGDLPAPSTITYDGNRSYLFTWNGVDYTSKIARGARLRGTRSTPVPTQVTTLNGTTQYWNKTTPNKLVFSDNFTLTATVKQAAATALTGNQYVGGRSDATAANAFGLGVNGQGQVLLFGSNGGSGNTRIGQSLVSIPYGREVKIAATWASGTILIYIDGVLVSSATTVAGTNPTTIGQAGDLAVGRLGSLVASLYAGEISQFAIYDAVLSLTTLKSLAGQGLTGAESNLKSGYAFNGTAVDLNTTTPNDLTANGSAGYATGGGFGNRGASSTIEYGVVQTDPAFSTNTTARVQVPEGCMFPTTGTMTSLDYSYLDTPFKFPRNSDRWELLVLLRSARVVSFPGINQWVASSISMAVPIGSYEVGWEGGVFTTSTVAGGRNGAFTFSDNGTIIPLVNGTYTQVMTKRVFEDTGTNALGEISAKYCFELAAATVFGIYSSILTATGTETFTLDGGSGGTCIFRARNTLFG